MFIFAAVIIIVTALYYLLCPKTEVLQRDVKPQLGRNEITTAIGELGRSGRWQLFLFGHTFARSDERGRDFYLHRCKIHGIVLAGVSGFDDEVRCPPQDDDVRCPLC